MCFSTLLSEDELNTCLTALPSWVLLQIKAWKQRCLHCGWGSFGTHCINHWWQSFQKCGETFPVSCLSQLHPVHPTDAANSSWTAGPQLPFLSPATALTTPRVLGNNIFMVGVKRLPFSVLQQKTKDHTSRFCCIGTMGHSILRTVMTVWRKCFSQK